MKSKAELAYEKFNESLTQMHFQLKNHYKYGITSILVEDYGKSILYVIGNPMILFLHLPSIYSDENSFLQYKKSTFKLLDSIENDMENDLSFKLNTLNRLEIDQLMGKHLESDHIEKELGKKIISHGKSNSKDPNNN